MSVVGQPLYPLLVRLGEHGERACDDALAWAWGRKVTPETFSAAPREWVDWLCSRLGATGFERLAEALGSGSGSGSGSGYGYGYGSGSGYGSGDGSGYGDGDG